jgi:predicted branched-subunit amino acid permease
MKADPIIRNALAIGVTTGAYAVSYGVLAVAAGLSIAQTCAMSALVFTGVSQFAVVGVLGAGGSVLAALPSAGTGGFVGSAPARAGRPL